MNKTFALVVTAISLGLCATVSVEAQAQAVRVVRDVPYLPNAGYADNKDKLDIYVPEGRRNAPVIVSYYGNQLLGGDRDEDAYVGRRMAAAGFVTVVVNY